MTRKEEISEKVKKVRGLLAAKNLKAVLIRRQDNFCWLTAGGQNVVTVADVFGIASILVTEKDCFYITNNIEHPRISEEEKLDELGFLPVTYEWFSGSEEKAVEGILALNEIGCDSSFGSAVNIGADLKKLRYSLLPSEIERYKWMGDKTSSAIETLLRDKVKPGMKECEVIGELSSMLWKDRIDSVCVQAAADDRAFRYRHAIPTEKKIEKYLMLNINARKWGLITTVTRSVYFGQPDKNLLKQYSDNVRIECSMIAATSPGARVTDIFKKTRELYGKMGYEGEWKNHHQGGAQGYANRDYLANDVIDETIELNQCICWNPSIAGTKSEDAFIAMKEGPVFITKPVVFPELRFNIDGIDFSRPALLVR